jgi:hypothetical protein
VLQDGRQIGQHTVNFERSGAGLWVSTAIDLELRNGYGNPFRFSHRSVSRRGLFELQGEQIDDQPP